MKRKYAVELTEEERVRAREIMHDPKTTKTFRNRANILLLADESQGKTLTYEEISKRCGVSAVTFYQVIKEYALYGLESTLHFRGREKPSNPPKITGEIEARVVALACGDAPEGYARWTVRLLSKRVVELGIIESVCPETIRSTLKKRSLSLT